MPKYFLLASLVFLAACGSSKKTGTDLPERNDIKGSWQVTDIQYSGLTPGERLSFTLLDEGSDACLKGSTWHLPNNGKGSYTIQSNVAGCQPGEKDIVWSYQKEGDAAFFLYKRMVGGVKPNDIADGYRFKIISVSETTWVMESTITYQGNLITITYTLAKT